MDVRWVTGFLDRPAHALAAAVDFWCEVADASLSPWRGDLGEFATLQPHDGGDPHLRVQRTGTEPGGSHLDLHVADPRRGAVECVDRGATVVADRGSYLVLRSPGAAVFCLVAHAGERYRQAPTGQGVRTLVDQITLDVGPAGFDAEVEFWTSVTGWPAQGGSAGHLVPLDRPEGLPLRLMLQRRDAGEAPAGCHLDLACDDVGATVSRHERIGATVLARQPRWTVMTDPTGVRYCLTARSPETGLLSPTR